MRSAAGKLVPIRELVTATDTQREQPIHRKDGLPLVYVVADAAATRAKPIVLTAVAAMLGAVFILDDPIFNGLAISLIFGIFVSTVLTLVVIPLLYFVAYRRRPAARRACAG